jgi:DNA-binding NarL/FixJ family response regulator
MNIRIGIVEDHTEFRLGLVFMFTGMSDYTVAWNFGSVEEAMAEGANVDVILLDINLPAISGIEAIPLFNKQFPGTRIIMLTVLEDAAHIIQAITAGADGYILKKTHPHKIPEAIEQVMEGGAVLTPIVARQIFSLFKPELAPPVSENDLTAREKEILTLLIDGQTDEKIAENLFISPQTVRSHIKNIYSKLQVHNRAEVVAKALKEHLLRI